MRKSALRTVAVAMAIGAVTSTGSALAAASTADHSAQQVSAQQVSALTSHSPREAAKQLKQLRANLKNANDQRDVAGVRQAVRGIDASLGTLRQRLHTWQLQSQTVQHVQAANTQNTELGRKLGAFTDQQLPQLPPVPPPLDAVSGLVQGLLASLQGIVNGLLPISSPPVAVPAVPVPAP